MLYSWLLNVRGYLRSHGPIQGFIFKNPNPSPILHEIIGTVKKTIYPWLMGSLCSLILLSCRSFKDPDFKSIENVRSAGLGLKNSTVLLDLRYYNPNASKLQLKRAVGDAWLEGVSLGHFVLDTLINIPAKSDFLLPVMLQVDMSNVLKNSATLFLKKEVTVRIEGMSRIGKSGFFINYPIKYEGKQNTDELLKITQQ